MVKRLESRPFVLTKDEDEGREIETGVVAHVFVLTSFTGVDIEIHDLGVDVLAILEGANERTNILERSASHQLRGGILQEAIVNR